MAIENVKNFFELVKSDEELAREIAKIKDEIQNKGETVDYEQIISKKVIPLAKEHGLDFTIEDFLKYTNSMVQQGELSDDDLLNVSGGMNLRQGLATGLLMLTVGTTGLSLMGNLQAPGGGGSGSGGQVAPDTSYSQSIDNGTEDEEIVDTENDEREDNDFNDEDDVAPTTEGVSMDMLGAGMFDDSESEADTQGGAGKSVSTNKDVTGGGAAGGAAKSTTATKTTADGGAGAGGAAGATTATTAAKKEEAKKDEAAKTGAEAAKKEEAKKDEAAKPGAEAAKEDEAVKTEAGAEKKKETKEEAKTETEKKSEEAKKDEAAKKTAENEAKKAAEEAAKKEINDLVESLRSGNDEEAKLDDFWNNSSVDKQGIRWKGCVLSGSDAITLLDAASKRYSTDCKEGYEFTCALFNESAEDVKVAGISDLKDLSNKLDEDIKAGKIVDWPEELKDRVDTFRNGLKNIIAEKEEAAKKEAEAKKDEAAKTEATEKQEYKKFGEGSLTTYWYASSWSTIGKHIYGEMEKVGFKIDNFSNKEAALSEIKEYVEGAETKFKEDSEEKRQYDKIKKAYDNYSIVNVASIFEDAEKEAEAAANKEADAKKAAEEAAKKDETAKTESEKKDISEEVAAETNAESVKKVDYGQWYWFNRTSDEKIKNNLVDEIETKGIKSLDQVSEKSLEAFKTDINKIGSKLVKNNINGNWYLDGTIPDEAQNETLKLVHNFYVQINGLYG